MGDFLDLARRRYSVRAYDPRPVSDEEVNLVMEAARLAPTACNRQPFRFLVVRKREMLSKLCSSYRGAWLAQAPCILVAIALPGEAWIRRQDRKNHAEIDLAIAVDHLTLAATDIGLGTCWICAFDAPSVSAILELSGDEVPVALVSLGEPADTAGDKQRKSLSDLVSEVG